jgi:ABC-2 type transport system permease protein
MNVFVKLTRNELRLFLREPLLVFFTLAFPSMLLAILGNIADFQKPSDEINGGRYVDLYVLIAITLSLGMLALQVTPSVLANYRERGILRRLSTTPVRPIRLLGAQLVMSLLIAVVSGAMVLTVGRLAFDVPFPRRPLAFLVAFVLAAAGVFAIGLLIAAVAPSGKAGNAIGQVLFFPTMFFAGLWLPREAMSSTLQRIGELTPLGAGEQALRAAATGSWPALGTVTVLVAYVVVFGLAAARLFRWE